jgi:hypothetical protein
VAQRAGLPDGFPRYALPVGTPTAGPARRCAGPTVGQGGETGTVTTVDTAPGRVADWQARRQAATIALVISCAAMVGPPRARAARGQHSRPTRARPGREASRFRRVTCRASHPVATVLSEHPGRGTPTSAIPSGRVQASQPTSAPARPSIAPGAPRPAARNRAPPGPWVSAHGQGRPHGGRPSSSQEYRPVLPGRSRATRSVGRVRRPTETAPATLPGPSPCRPRGDTWRFNAPGVRAATGVARPKAGVPSAATRPAGAPAARGSRWG